MSTSTPVVYGDIVLFSAGSGVVPNSGGNGNFIVADANTLEGLYAVPMLAYPQASVLVSTAYLKETGKLYCYTTYNGKPGGMTLITLDPNDRTGKSAAKSEIYSAPGHEQYCIFSPICGPDGTIYYRNDSGWIFALTNNNAYLTALAANAGTLKTEFKAGVTEYEMAVPSGTKSVKFNATACQGGTVTVNGKDASIPVEIVDGTATVEIKVTVGDETRTYTVNIVSISNDSYISELNVNETNAHSSFKTLTPTFKPTTYFYGFYEVGSDRSFENIWAAARHKDAKVTVYAGENVDDTGVNSDGSISVTSNQFSTPRYAVYFQDDSKPMYVRVQVTAEDGSFSNYYVVMSMTAAAAEGRALLEKLQKESSDAVAAVVEKINTIGTVTLESKAAIDAARAAYGALANEQRAQVNNLDKLTAAEDAYEALLADQDAAKSVSDMIDAIGTVTKESKDAIEAARAAYDALTDSQKALVGGEKLQTLVNAEAALKKLNEQPGQTGGKDNKGNGDSKPGGSVSTGDNGMALYIGLSVTALLGLAVIPAARKKRG